MVSSHSQWLNAYSLLGRTIAIDDDNISHIYPKFIHTGTHIQLKRPRTEAEPDIYINRHGDWSINVLAVSDESERYIYYKVGAFGSAHDARVLRNSNLPLLNALPPSLCILGKIHNLFIILERKGFTTLYYVVISAQDCLIDLVLNQQLK